MEDGRIQICRLTKTEGAANGCPFSLEEKVASKDPDKAIFDVIAFMSEENIRYVWTGDDFDNCMRRAESSMSRWGVIAVVIQNRGKKICAEWKVEYKGHIVYRAVWSNIKDHPSSTGYGEPITK